tara:strand:+ start:245 stop:520 length:276 start_codon:yes stop_codon:yes gene_type:complete
MALTKRQKQNTIREVKHHDDDTGSTEVQIALLTRRINELSDHLKKHRKDNHSRRGLLKLVAQRRKLIKYLQAASKKRYNEVAEKLGLKTVA